jgi:NitT/TauT family transport system substrate-binding protein
LAGGPCGLPGQHATLHAPVDMTGAPVRMIMLLIGLLAVVLAGPCGAAETVRVGKPSTNHNFLFSLVDVGVRAGVFARHGLAVETANFNGSPRMMQAMVGGNIDIGINTGPDMAMIAKGAPFTAVAAISGAPDLGLGVRPDGPVHTIDDLKGRKVSASGTASVTGWLVTELSRQQGWGSDGIPIVVATGAATWALLKTQEIDGICTDVGSILLAEQRGAGKLLLRFADRIPRFHMYVLFATNEMLQAHPETVRAFVRGWFDTLAYVRAHKAETIRVANEVIGLGPEILGKLYDTQLPLYSATGTFDREALNVLSRSYIDMKTLAAEPDMAALYTEAFLPKR